MIRVIAFDADDTLWHTERLYLGTKTRFMQLLQAYQSPDWIDARLLETELRNLQHFGYGIKSFTLSMIETAVELTEGRIRGSEVHEIIALAREMLQTPVELLEDVEPTIRQLADDYRLMIITKGDLFEQETKIAASRLGDHFDLVEVVSEKTPQTYRAIATRLDVDPTGFLMVGNSLKSDVLPVVECGAHAIHVPYETTWAAEHVPSDVANQYHFHRAHSIREVPEIVAQLNGRR